MPDAEETQDDHGEAYLNTWEFFLCVPFLPKNVSPLTRVSRYIRKTF